MTAEMGLRARQAQATRTAILEAAADLFSKQGFAGTSVSDILARTGIARGALYHHFTDKESLFATVWAATLRQAVQSVISAASKSSDVWLALRRGREAYLDSCTDPATVRILLIDGPNILSPDAREKITDAMGPEFKSGALQRASFDALVENGQIEARESFEPLVAIMTGAFDSAAMAIATAADRRRARREIGDALNLLIDGLQAALTPPAQAADSEAREP